MAAAEARAAIERFRADLDRRLAAFRSTLDRLGGPAEAVDGSLDGLDRVWDWFLAQPVAPASDDVALERGPWWTTLHLPWVTELGPDLATHLTGAADAFHLAAESQHPATWRMCRLRSSPEFRRPVLALDGRGEVPYTVPIVLGVRAVSGDPDARRADALRRLLERWLGRDPEHEALLARAARPLGRFHVAPLDDGDWTHRVDVDEGIARSHDRRLDELVAGLTADATVLAAQREDREVIVVRAPGVSSADLLRLLESRWVAARRRS